jgi:hypothetical protein
MIAAFEKAGNAIHRAVTTRCLRLPLDDDGRAFCTGDTAPNPVELLTASDRALDWGGIQGLVW